jgi:hypothetical protein
MEMLNLGKLKYSEGKEEGCVEINWEKMPKGIMLLDILQDWVVELEDIYETKRQEVFPEGESK